MIYLIINEWIFILLSIIPLSVGAYLDIRDRLVPNKVWLIQGILGLLVLIWYSVDLSFIQIIYIVINIIIGFLFGFVSFITGAMGGADAKAIIVLSISSPFYFIKLFPWKTVTLIPPIFFIVINMGITLLIFALLMLLYNLYSIKKMGPLFQGTSGGILSKINVLISAYRIDQINMDNMKHKDPVEEYSEENGWELSTSVFTAPMDDEEFEKVEREARERAIETVKITGKKFLWVRPQPPGLVFLLIAYIYWLLLGSPATIFFY